MDLFDNWKSDKIKKNHFLKLKNRFDWIKGGDEENQPTIIPGGILDIEKSNFNII